jgi:hypothetical protein
MRVPTDPWMVSFSVTNNLDGNFNLSSNLWFIFLIWSFINPPHIYPPIYACAAEIKEEFITKSKYTLIIDS